MRHFVYLFFQFSLVKIRNLTLLIFNWLRASKDEHQREQMRKHLNRERSTRLEGSFGTEKQHYTLSKVKARTKETEILWIFFGIHTANAVRMIPKVERGLIVICEDKMPVIV